MQTKRTLRSNPPEARRDPPSAIAWPYRWLFALTECGEQRSPAACLCECVCTRRTQTQDTHTMKCPLRLYGCVPKPLSILSMRRRRIVPPRIAGTLGARNLEAGVVSLIVMKLISVLKFRNRYFEITPLFHQRDYTVFSRSFVAFICSCSLHSFCEPNFALRIYI